MDGSGPSDSDNANAATGSNPQPPADPGARVNGLPAEWTPELRIIMSRITIAGCLAVVFMQFTAAAPRVDLLKAIGASYRQFGIIESIPLALLLAQFVGGFYVNRLSRRKPLWMVLTIFHRFLAVPFALLPYFFPDMDTAVLVWSLIGILVLSSASAHFGVPIWFSWMSDILPHRSLGEYWARRRRWQSIVSMATLASTAWFFWEYGDIDIRVTFMVISMFGALAGIVDIVLFWNIPEPKMARHESQRLQNI